MKGHSNWWRHWLVLVQRETPRMFCHRTKKKKQKNKIFSFFLKCLHCDIWSDNNFNKNFHLFKKKKTFLFFFLQVGVSRLSGGKTFTPPSQVSQNFFIWLSLFNNGSLDPSRRGVRNGGRGLRRPTHWSACVCECEFFFWGFYLKDGFQHNPVLHDYA